MPFPEHGPSFRIRLVEGYRVIDPLTNRPVPEDKEITVPNNSYWRRRVRAGECALVVDGEQDEKILSDVMVDDQEEDG